MPFKLPMPGALARGILTLACALVLFIGTGHSQKYHFDPVSEKAWESVLMFRFAEAQAIIDRQRSADPSNLLPRYIENYIDFLILFTGENNDFFEEAKDRKDLRLAELEKGDHASPYYRFCLADVNIQWAFARLKFKEYTAAGLELRKANELLRENQSLYPGFLPNRLGLGVLHALSGVIPENYKWLAGLIGLEGGLEQGVNELESIVGYTGTDPFTRALKVPACLFTALIDASLRTDKSAALEMIGRFGTDPDLVPYTASPVVVYARSSICLKTGHNEMALAALSSRTADQGTYPFHFLDYLHGLALLNDLDPSAAVAFRTFLSGFGGRNYIKSSWQKIAWSSLLAGDTLSYQRSIRMVLTLGNRETDEDKQAWYEASSGEIPNITLLQARLLYDGGYYNRALDELLHRSLKHYVHNKRDLAEYYYRLGRIYQAMGQNDRAMQNYRTAVRQGKTLPQYFAAGASLQMGSIHEMNREFAQADSCYRLCLTLDYQEYKTSLSQKAKAGLNRVKKELP